MATLGGAGLLLMGEAGRCGSTARAQAQPGIDVLWASPPGLFADKSAYVLVIPSLPAL